MHPSAISHHIGDETAVSRGRHWVLGALTTAILAGIALCGTTVTQAQTPAPAVKLYILDLGSLKSANPKPLLDRGVTVTDMSVVAYLVVHPRGTLLWDSGTIPDDQIKPGGTTVARGKSSCAVCGSRPVAYGHGTNTMVTRVSASSS